MNTIEEKIKADIEHYKFYIANAKKKQETDIVGAFKFGVPFDICMITKRLSFLESIVEAGNLSENDIRQRRDIFFHYVMQRTVINTEYDKLDHLYNIWAWNYLEKLINPNHLF